MNEPRVAHCVRRYGGLTEPFIEQRVRASGTNGQLWCESLVAPAPAFVHRVRVPFMKPGTLGDRLFHHFPAIAPPLAVGYSRLEAEERPDVIHAHYLTTGYLVGTRTRAPLVISTYGFDITVMPRRGAWMRVMPAVARRASSLLVEGPFMRESLIRLGFTGEQVAVVPIAADLDTIPYRDPRVPSGPTRLLITGRLVPKKGHAVALRALAAVAAEMKPAPTLDIIGSGPLLQRLIKLVQELRIADLVRFTASIPRLDYLQRVRESTMVLAPSVTAPNGDSEGGAPTTILDAQAVGTIVVGSTHADIPFLIDEGRTGYLAREGDTISLADAIMRALDDQERWASIARAARRQVEERHSNENVAALLSAVHRSVLR